MRYFVSLILFSGIVFLLSLPLTAQVIVNNAVKENGAVNDGKPLDPAPEVKLDLAGFGCITGFSGWVEPPKSAEIETACDEDNLKQFKKVFGKCVSDRHTEKLPLYDIDKDSCVTCADYFAWKDSLKQLFASGKRSTDGQELIFEACDKGGK